MENDSDIISLSPVPGGVRIFRIGCVQVQNIMNIPVVHEPAGDICENNAGRIIVLRIEDFKYS